MTIKIYNSLTRTKEEFKPLKEGKVGMYVCGPTVYDEPHIGHARSAYIFDVIRRYLKYKKFDVLFVRNVTDVDDKIINKAKEGVKGQGSRVKGQGSGARLIEETKEISEKYLESYHDAMKIMGIDRPTKEPRATEYIPKMVKFIKLLIKNECAYIVGADVYFDIKKVKDYGKLSNQSLDKMEAGARVSPDEKKKDPMDFALWKAAKEDEPSWDSPWGKGRPGWHIECSAMSSDILGDEFDIHGGGIDLIFPHHENEVAQSDGAGKKFARYWIHHGLLTINGQKMAKSLGNFVTVNDFADKYKNMDLLKMFFLSTHYSHPIDYTEGKIEEAKKAYERIDILMEKLARKYATKNIRDRISDETGLIKPFKDGFIEYMDDDFNMPRALSVLFDMINRCNILLDSNEELKDFILAYAMDVIKEMTEVFGLDFLKGKTTEMSDSEVDWAISSRNALRKEKKFKEADEVRKKLDEKDIILEDTKDGTTWRRKI